MDRDSALKGCGGKARSCTVACATQHGGVSCSSGPGRSFDIQLIRDQNRDSSESASRFETGSGREIRVCETNTSHARVRERAVASSSIADYPGNEEENFTHSERSLESRCRRTLK